LDDTARHQRRAVCFLEDKMNTTFFSASMRVASAPKAPKGLLGALAVMAFLLVLSAAIAASPAVILNGVATEQAGRECLRNHGPFAAWQSFDGQLRMLCQPPGGPIYKINLRLRDGQWTIKYVEKFDDLAQAIARAAKNATRVTADALSKIKEVYP
jgi:hypothetical protein